ncbi:2'-5' RNA ligase family protein [Rhizobium sp. CFBP 8762]|uniref:2'-5' RNA ligase family protein n=1 Tax=Rhizobium sp. CFBP 8762 TaxID=2775279 RepID=UPI0017860D6B|nr:2'-5' RNA ligase family protein [Rhizobium sp. CFBP 8762]MBD8554401.1 2'-5' RNA ligase family protein [Rhizobium sp. CFBP 8762]
MTHPLILTARISDGDLEPFDRLRRQHFPAERNFLRAHLTLFHHLPADEFDRIVELAQQGLSRVDLPMPVEVTGVRHMGAGVAYTLESPALQAVRAHLVAGVRAWLKPQDLQGWRPHITVQNKVSKAKADTLFQDLRTSFRPQTIASTGLDIWSYLGGPWRLETSL